MHRLKRAFGAVLATTVIGSGAGLATAAHANAAAPRPTQEQRVLELLAVQLPVLNGTGEVGSLLTLTDPVWNVLVGVTNSYQWLRDGSPIAGATNATYTPVLADAGHAVSARVTGTVAGLLPVQTLTTALPIPVPSGGGTPDPLSLVADVLPLLSGTPGVGSVLTVTDPVWSLPDVVNSYQWLRDGSPISGATNATYTPVLADAGHAVSARVTGTVAGLLPVQTLTTALPIPLPSGGGGGGGGGTPDPLSLVADVLPLLSGVPGVGSVLTVTDPVWSLPDVTNTYQWLRDGSPISGATNATYTPVLADAGHAVSARVTGTVAGLLPVQTLTTALPIPLPDGGGGGGETPDPLSLVADVLPLLSGVPGVGSVLTVTDPVWSLPDVVNSYTWMSDGIPISGATDSTYVPSAADAGSQITALVTGSLQGILPVNALSNAIDIPAPSGGGGGGGSETPEPFTLLGVPTLTGVPGVGQVVGLTSIEWSLPGVTTSVQWLSNGVPIPDATDLTFIPGADLAGTQLSALITGTLVGLPVVSQLTSALGIASAEPDAITASVAPTVSGLGKVGTLLTGEDPTWSTTNVTTTYQWLRNSVAIPGATQKTYALVGEDFGKQVSLKTTGTKNGTTGTAASAPVLAKLGDALVATSAPSITGRPAAGNVMTVQPGAWSGSPVPTFVYQWYVNGSPISGANASTYVVRPVVAGRNLAVLVTASRVGYAPGTAATAPVKVAKVASRTKLSLVKKKVAAGKRALVKITLAATGLRPAGKVTIFDGRKKLRTYTVRRADNGSRVVVLPRLKSGRHVLTARFRGSIDTTTSKSAKVVLRVLRRK